MSGGLQPNSALGRKPLFPELGPYLLCQHERTFRRPAASNQLSSDIRFRSSAASDVAEQRGISRLTLNGHRRASLSRSTLTAIESQSLRRSRLRTVHRV